MSAARPIPRIALLIETSSAYGRGLLRGIAQYARLYGPWSFFIEPGGLEMRAPPIRDWGVDGIIARVHTRRLAAKIRAARVPTVDLDYALPHLFPYGITNNDPQVGRLAGEHLLALGLRHFAFCGWGRSDDSTVAWESARLKAFGETVREAGFDVSVYSWPARRGDWAWAREQKQLARWIAGLPRPAGLMAANDQRGRHVLEAAAQAGVRVPKDLAVVGVDNDEVLCEMADPPLSSVELNTRQIGFEAASLLHKLLSRRRGQERAPVVEPLGVVARQSTDMLAMDDEVVQTAARFIRANAHRPIQVSDVLGAVPVSRKTLEVRFQRALGRTPHDEIHRIRLQRVKDLLAQTDWPLRRIAGESGFAYAEHMHALFRRRVRMTPARYRALHRGR